MSVRCAPPRHWHRRSLRRNGRIRACGMTLVELLIAISIASLLAVAGYRALASLTASATQLAQTTQRWQALEAHAQAVEQAYRRAVPGALFDLQPDSLTLSMLDGHGVVQSVRFGATDAQVSAWAFFAWDGAQWLRRWHGSDAPPGLRITLTTAQGETVERVYAR